MFYTVFGTLENFDDISMNNSEQPMITNSEQPNNTNSQQPNNTNSEQPMITNLQQPMITNSQQPMITNSQQPNNTTSDDKFQGGFVQTNTATPQNIMQFKQKLNIDIFNESLINASNIDKFKYNTIGIQTDIIFDFILSLVGTNKPFITNIVNFNKNYNNKITFNYKDQYNYNITLTSDELLNNGLYNIIYLPIQPKMAISNIDVTIMDLYNIMNGTIITVNNDILLTLPHNKIFEIYILPIKNINLVVNYFENITKTFTLEENTYYYIYYNRTNPDKIVISQLNIVNLNFVTIPTNVKLSANSNLIYYNNFLNFYNNQFYNIINKQYDTTIMNCSDCSNNIKSHGSRYSTMSYYGTDDVYLQLPELNLGSEIVTFSINFKTNNNTNQILFDMGNVSSDDKYVNSLFVNFENNTVRFNYVKNNELQSTFLHVEGNPQLNNNQWHNIIWTINNNQWIIYVDGILVLNDTKINPLKNKFYCASNFIGKKNNISTLVSEYTNFVGYIDNFKIFDKALTDYEIYYENIKLV